LALTDPSALPGRWRRQAARSGWLSLVPRAALFVDELLTAAQVDVAHAEAVAGHAERLFMAARPLHGLGNRMQTLLRWMALLHNVGVQVDEPRHHTAGRDLLMAMRLIGVSDVEQRMIACAIRFHRKSVRPEEEPLFKALPRLRQPATLWLSALLRIADGLDYSTTQTTTMHAELAAARRGRPAARLKLLIAGRHAGEDAARAVAKSDLWASLTPAQLEVEVAVDWSTWATLPLTPSATALDALKRALADQLVRWADAAPAAPRGDVAAIKALRAAARRSRAAVTIFSAELKGKTVRRLRRDLKRMEDVLGAVRDWDVLLADAREALGERPARSGHVFDPQAYFFSAPVEIVTVPDEDQADVLEAWGTARAEALAAARAFLADDAPTLRADLEQFASQPPGKAHTPLAPLADLAPALLANLLPRLRERAQQAEADGGYAAYHAVRLALKRVRFTLEFLAPLYGRPADEALKRVIKLQDRLGGLNDLHVAHNRVLAFLEVHPGHGMAIDYMRRLAREMKTQLGKCRVALADLSIDSLPSELSIV
jgi:CHAD domain-containing protein